MARSGNNPWVISKLPSGWAVMGDVQFLQGYCLLLADPVVPSLNDLAPMQRIQLLQDMARIGNALLNRTGAYRINYEILGNSDPELLAHIFPRYMSEPEERRRMPAEITGTDGDGRLAFYVSENVVTGGNQASTSLDNTVILDTTPPGPGRYRLEAELKILGEWTPWVYTNPIRLESLQHSIEQKKNVAWKNAAFFKRARFLLQSF